MNRFQKIDNTAPIQSKLKADTPDVQRSLFDLTRIKNTTVNIGEITVIDCIETLPGDVFKNINYIINLQSRNPTIKAQLTGMRAYVHVYYNRMSDLWEGAQNFIDSGTSGKVQLTIPTLRTNYKTEKSDTENFTICTAMSLTNMLDVPPTMYKKDRARINHGMGSLIKENGVTFEKLSPEYGNEEINALPYVMYQKLYVEKYAPRNLIQENKNFIPDNQRHFILPYNANIVSTLSYTDPDSMQIIPDKYMLKETGDQYIDPNSTLLIPESTSPDDPVWLGAIRYRQKKGDYFNTALPFAQLLRGDIPTMETAIQIQSMNLELNNNPKIILEGNPNLNLQGQVESNPLTQVGGIRTRIGIGGNGGVRGTEAWTDGSIVTGEVFAWGNGNSTVPNTSNTGIKNFTIEDFSANVTGAVGSIVGIDLATINALEAYTIFRQRMALTNGRYNEMVKAQYGYSPHAPTTDAQYIGGFYLDLNQQEITQTSETNKTPLGYTAGKMNTTGASGKLTFRAPDYGYIMAVLSIVPDTYQDKGLERWTTRKEQSETYFPIFNNLAPQAILNKELFWSGDPNIDNDIYGWTERYGDYKERKNKVTGLLAIKTLSDSAYISMDTYNTLPTLSNSFVTLSRQNVDMNIFTSSEEPPFIASIGEIVKVVRAMPYITMPAGLKSNNM